MLIEKTLRSVVLLGVFLLPFIALFVSTSLFFPYITGKNFAFRIIVEIMAGAYLALALVRTEYRPKRSWILAALATFVFIIALADLFGAYPFKSIWSNFERMDGWVTLGHLFVYTVIAASVLHTEKMWRWLWWTTLGVSVVVAVYGFLQVAGATALGQGGSGGLGARIDATFGNPIYLAVYMLFHVFIAAMLWAQMWVERRPGTRLAPSIAYGSIILLDTAALLFTGTRGTTIGLVGGTFLSVLILVLLANRSRNAWRAAVAAVVGIVVLVGGFWMIRDAAWVNRIGFLQRLATISTSDNTVKARFINWSIAWQGVQERPILGWGQENYALVFDKYYDPRMYQQEPWFDRVHNIVFDWLVAGGFLGLFSYLAIFGATVWVLWRSGAFTIAERAILTGLLAAYFCHNFFVFDNVTSYILFGTVLAYVMYRAGMHTHAHALLQDKKIFPPSALPYISVFMAFIVWGTAWTVNATALSANRTIIAALQQQSDPLKNLNLFKEAINEGSYGTQEAREQLAQAAATASQLSIPVTTKQSFYEAAANEMKLQAQASPLDARFPLFQGVVMRSYGNLQGASEAFAKALELSPKKQTILFEIGQTALLRGDNAAAITAFKQAHELGPQFLDPKLFYAAVLIRGGKLAEADQLLRPHIATGEAADQRVLAAYVQIKRFDKVAQIWQARLNARPDDVQAYFTLAALYYQAGENARAIQVLEQAGKAHPEVKSQADDLIQQVRSGTVR